MYSRDWLLLSIGDRMEPIQLQKTLFKFAMESGGLPDESYEFEPYNWVPCSFGIYEDLSTLREEGLVETVPSGRGWNLYRLTESGKTKATELSEQGDATLLKALDDARNWVTSRTFEMLLKDIYEQYPEYATESLFAK